MCDYLFYMPFEVKDSPNRLLRDLFAQREKRGVTLRELAERAGFANASVPSKLEHKDSNPTIRSLMKYAAGLGARGGDGLGGGVAGGEVGGGHHVLVVRPVEGAEHRAAAVWSDG